ncbi:MAG: two-component sensor histidine kinase [Dehalococcoidia bacterium]|nr:MAG: two-component sensor histidine kinase [Dehalococcoidia bacterium]
MAVLLPAELTRPALARLPLPKLSIRLRLTILFSAILGLALCFFGVALSLAFSGVTLRLIESTLASEAEQLLKAREFRLDNIVLPAGKLATPETFVQTRGLDGQILSKTPNLGSETLPLDREGLEAARATGRWVETVQVDDGRLLVLSVPIVLGNRTVGYLQVARSLRPLDEAAGTLQRIALAGAALALVAAFGIGWGVAGWALAPIAAITATAQRIGDNRDFTHRVAHTGPDDEIGRLASTFNRMLAELQAAYLHAEGALQAQRRLAADASHELRTPLTTIRGNLSLLQRDPPIAAEDRVAVLADMTEETDRLIRLVNDLLVLARADAGVIRPPERVPVRPLLNDLVRRAAATWPDHVFRAEPADAAVAINRDALVQVLLILLDNAAKHTQRGGTITLGAEATDRQVTLRVADTGSGIPAEVLPHIFERFYRGDSARTGAGAGLGLAIAKAIVDGSGGTIGVRSTPGAGSEFRVTLPRAA